MFLKELNNRDQITLGKIAENKLNLKKINKPSDYLGAEPPAQVNLKTEPDENH